ncbi:Gfo/Idh/MocA family protein [Streptomyces sp. NPDC058221]|uniref:Gfo/Idh/MocA family protein n=1 Tax=Streptomyces sp. NPDC058221 TaxID=3346388 RepID=UPI0036EE5359
MTGPPAARPEEAGAALRFGVLGTASIARRRFLPALAGVPGVTAVAVASRDPDRAQRFAEEFGCEAAGGYQTLLDRDDIDAVYIPLPAALHHRWAAAALERGKHVLLEKPFTVCAREARELVDKAQANGLVVRENFAFLHHAVHRRVRDLLDQGRLGRLRSVQAAFCIPPLPAHDIRYSPSLGGGALLEAGVYPVRVAQHYLGDELTVAGAVLRADPGTGVDVEGSVLLASPGGPTATLHFGFEHAYAARYQLWGSRGRVSLERAYAPPPSFSPVLRIEEQNHVEEISLPPEDQFATALTGFVQAVAARRASAPEPPTPTPPAATVRTAELLDAIRERAGSAPATPGSGT